MQDEFGQLLQEAAPSTPVAITGLSDFPEAGQEFIVVKEREGGREISEARTQGAKHQNAMHKKEVSMDNLLQQASEAARKCLNVILRADVQGSLEAFKTALNENRISESRIECHFAGVGEVSESDVQLAAASKAVDYRLPYTDRKPCRRMSKQLGIKVKLHDIIYHAIDDVKALMAGSWKNSSGN